ncbi:MAG TPA: lysophospholipid acyltransferase family protein [Vicinamibacteria bacterium]|nr:lysophospholipid acyltransferase family protein [Vicinamibacteria bacterium]
MALLRAVRSLLSVLAVVLYLCVFGPVLMYLWLRPAALLRPSRQRAYLSRYMKIMAGGILHLLRLGGARFERIGVIRTESPVLIVMNHQSLIDILSLTMMSEPYVPAFVTRTRYARFVPAVSPCVRMLGGPNIDPKRDPRGARDAMREAAPRQRHGLILFPEGHRSRDGEVQPFKTAGAQAILGVHPMPVQIVVTDGGWKTRRMVDFLFNVPLLQVRTEALGTIPPPASESEVPAFLTELRARMQDHLARMRADAAA